MSSTFDPFNDDDNDNDNIDKMDIVDEVYDDEDCENEEGCQNSFDNMVVTVPGKNELAIVCNGRDTKKEVTSEKKPQTVINVSRRADAVSLRKYNKEIIVGKNELRKLDLEIVSLQNEMLMRKRQNLIGEWQSLNLPPYDQRKELTMQFLGKNPTMKKIANPYFNHAFRSFEDYETFLMDNVHFPLKYAEAVYTANFRSVYVGNHVPELIKFFYPYCTYFDDLIISKQTEEPLYSHITIVNRINGNVYDSWDGIFVPGGGSGSNIGGTRGKVTSTRKHAGSFQFLQPFSLLPFNGMEKRHVDSFLDVIREYKKHFDYIEDSYKFIFDHAIDEIGYYYLNFGVVPNQKEFNLEKLLRYMNPDFIKTVTALFYSDEDIANDKDLLLFKTDFSDSDFSIGKPKSESKSSELKQVNVTKATENPKQRVLERKLIPKDYITVREYFRRYVALLVREKMLVSAEVAGRAH